VALHQELEMVAQFVVMSAPGVLDIIVGHLSKPSEAVKVRNGHAGNPIQYL